MPDDNQEIVAQIIDNILWALKQILKRFTVIDSADDFLDSDEGIEKLDSICMQLINVGEAVKQIDKITQKELLIKYSAMEWNKVIGICYIITYHYFYIDAKHVFTVYT